MITECVVLMGVGGVLGKDFKLNIVKKVRAACSVLVLVEEAAHWCEKEGIADHIISVRSAKKVDETVAEVIACISRYKLEPTAVVSFRDDWLLAKARLAEVLGLRTVPAHAYDLALDKLSLKRELFSKGLVSDIPIDIHEVLGILEELPHSIIAKPRRGCRSEWVREISSRYELERFFQQCPERQTLMVERRIVGHEVDADLFLVDGVVKYAAVSDNFPTRLPFALETGHLMPSILPKQLQEKTLSYAGDLAVSCGLRDGNLHIEIIIDKNGTPHVIEINPRIGGMYIPEWHQKLFGVDLVLAEISLAAGLDPAEHLVKVAPGFAIAQLCIIDNLDASDPPLKLFEHKSGDDISVAAWVELPLLANLTKEKNGPANIGELTVYAKTPVEAFTKLVAAIEDDAAITIHLADKVGISCQKPFVDSSFMLEGPVDRFFIRSIEHGDLQHVCELLGALTGKPFFLSALQRAPHELPPFYVVEDRLLRRIVACCAVAYWGRYREGRQQAGYIHDFIVSPRYRQIGLGSKLLNFVINQARMAGCTKIEIACEPALTRFYSKFGFSSVAEHMAMYPESSATKNDPVCQLFSEMEVAAHGRGLMLAHTEYLCERNDPEHRPWFFEAYPHYKHLFDKWIESGVETTLWDWLKSDATLSYCFDRGYDLSRKIEYFDEFEKSKCRVYIRDDRLLDSFGRYCDTRLSSTEFAGPGWALLVVDINNNLFLTPHDRGRLQHTSISLGGIVKFAGEISVFDGRIRALSNRSGHYRPNDLDTIVEILRKEKILKDDVDLVTVSGQRVSSAERTFAAIDSDGDGLLSARDLSRLYRLCGLPAIGIDPRLQRWIDVDLPTFLRTVKRVP